MQGSGTADEEKGPGRRLAGGGGGGAAESSRGSADTPLRGGILLGSYLPTAAATCFPRKEIFFFGFMLLITKHEYGNVLCTAGRRRSGRRAQNVLWLQYLQQFLHLTFYLH